MENPELVNRFAEAEKLLKEAKEHYEVSISLVDKAFELISSTVINGGLKGFQKDQGERFRRLAIRCTALALESMEKGDVVERLNNAAQSIYDTVVTVRLNPTSWAKDVQKVYGPKHQKSEESDEEKEE